MEVQPKNERGDEVKLNDKDYLLLQVLCKSDICNIRTLTILNGAHVERVELKRVHKLVKEGLIKQDMFNGHMVYALTRKGLSELEINRTPTELRGYSVEHTEKIALIASWIYMATGRSIFDVDFSRNIKKYPEYDGKSVHVPDLVFGNTCVEVELNRKADNRLEKNFKDNASLYSQQIWLIPERKHGLEATLEKLSAKYDCKVDIRYMERVEKTFKEYELTNNEPRYIAIKPDNPPRARYKNIGRIEFDD